ncbi:MAG: OmpA family protein [Alphaproteobacteria bacterium]
MARVVFLTPCAFATPMLSRLIPSCRIFVLATLSGLVLLAFGMQASAKNNYPDTADSVQVFIDEAVPMDKGTRSWSATPLVNLRRYVKPRQNTKKTTTRSRRTATAQAGFVRAPAMPVEVAPDTTADVTEMDASARISAVRAGMEETIRARVIEKMNEGRRRPAEPTAPSQAVFGGGIPVSPTILPPGQKGSAPAEATEPSAEDLAAPVLPGARTTKRFMSGVPEKCVNKIMAWTRACPDMGYPEDFGGIVHGETRIICAAGERRDIWLSNSCAARQPVMPETASVAEREPVPAAPDKTPISMARAENVVPKPAPEPEVKPQPAPEPVSIPEAPRAAVSGEEKAPQTTLKEPTRPAAAAFGADLPGAVPSVPVDTTPLIPAVIGSATRNAAMVSMCGTAIDGAAVAAPSRGLCFRGTPGKVSGSGPWNWTCSDDSGQMEKCATRMPLLAECGPMDSQKLKEVPLHGLCNAGAPSPVRGEGPWHWTCDGGKGGTRVMCSAAPDASPAASQTAVPAKSVKSPKKTAAKAKREVSQPSRLEPAAQSPSKRTALKSVDGVCGNAVATPLAARPDHDLCHAGEAEQLKGAGPWTWVCRGRGTGLNVTCVAEAQGQGRLPSAVDGACGSAAKSAISVMPVKDLCAAGVPGQVSGAGPWAWSCGGINGGMAATCFTQTTAQSRVPVLVPQAPDDLPAPPPIEEIPQYEPRSGNNDIGLGADDYMPAPPVQGAPAQKNSGRSGLTLVDPNHASIRFDSGSDAIGTESMPVITALGQRLGENPGGHVTVTAYADLQTAGNDARAARRLSLSRALAVRDILIINGATDGQVKIRAKGANVTKGNPDRVDFTD